MGLESLKRVLLELKGEARKMRGAEVKTRMGPVKEVSRVREPEVSLKVGEPVEVSREPQDDSPPGAPEAEPAEDTLSPQVNADDTDLKRVLRKHGLA